MSKDAILKLQAIEDKINSNNSELYSQALTTCRRLFENTANELFNKHFPNYKDKNYKTKSGKKLILVGNIIKISYQQLLKNQKINLQQRVLLAAILFIFWIGLTT